MTENEAIERIRSGICNERGTQRFCRDSCMYGIDKCAYSMAIQALEEIQQYRAIGTVEGYERAIKSSIENYSLYREYKAKVQQFETIGTVEEIQLLVSKGRAYDQVAGERDIAISQLEDIGVLFGQKMDDVRAAVERMKPKKPIILDRRIQNGDEVCTEWKCPVCGLNVIEEPPCQEYCQRCGNKLDWSE